MSEQRQSLLRGRLRECRALDRVVVDARSAQGQVLVLRGEAGVGKSALLNYVIDRATGFRIAQAAGVESEFELAYAGLHQLCAPMLEYLDRLPQPQCDALRTAFGMSTGAPPDRFLVGLGVLSLFAELAEQQPLLCVVDDVQWLDEASAQILSFVARRLLAESIAVVFATRPTDREAVLRGLPELHVGGLDDDAARALLLSGLASPLDSEVIEQIVAESRGNPLALLELPRVWVASDPAGGFGLPEWIPLTNRMERGFVDRLNALPAGTRLLLLTAAAEPIGDPSLLWRAADTLALSADAASPAEAAGLIEFGTRVRFRHPLVRSMAYWSATPEDRHRVHQALARATDRDVDPDRRAWHLAQAAPGPDEAVAAELERSAGRAQGRGGLAAAAAFLERATALTPDPADRATRALAAAQAKLVAGASDSATALLAIARAGPLNELQYAQAELIHAQLAFASSRGHDAPSLLIAAARTLEPLDWRLSQDTYLDALAAALFVGSFAIDAGASEVAAASRLSMHTVDSPPDLLLDGLATVIADGYEVGAPRLKRALAAFRTEKMAEAEAVRWLWLATHAAGDLWDDESWDVLCSRHVSLSRKAGALAILPIAINSRIGLHLFAGELAAAESLVEEVAAVTEATGNRLPAYGAVALAAWQGREAETSRLIAVALEDISNRGEGLGLSLVKHAQAVLYNSLGRYSEALIAAEQAGAHPEELTFALWSLVQLIEAAVGCDQKVRAAEALDQLRKTTRASGTPWALGVEARCRALLSEGHAAEGSYLDAIDHLARTRLPMELARARLLYGEWLGREHRQADARQQLRAAHTAFANMGADGFAERARRELTAAGESVRAASRATSRTLTAQEAQIAAFAAAGRTNPEIGAELFLSPRTVEWHLRKVFTKLDVSSRRQLRSVLPDVSWAVTPN